jgi:S-(hydroxymethyl)glutathione dehydrogenase/alcohol dehydrogenase
MRALVFDENGLAVRTDVELARRPAPHQVVVEVEAAGVCHSDFKVVRGTTRYPTPVVLGHEGAGRVVEVGSAVRSVRVGDRVVVHTLRFCGRCRACASGRPTQCRTAPSAIETPFVASGEPLHQFANTSVFVERTVVAEEQVVAVDPAVPAACAALLGCGVLTGTGAVFNRARVRRGDRVAVLGVGGVGLNVVQAAKIAGASVVVAVDTNEGKESVAREFGATHFALGGRELEAQLGAIEPDGMDVFVCIGNPALVSGAVPLLAPGGQVVIVGFPGPGVTADVPIQALYQDKSILACRYGTSSPHRDIPLLAEMYLDGRLKLDELVSNTLPLSKAATAFDDMAAGRTDARTVLEIGA